MRSDIRVLHYAIEYEPLRLRTPFRIGKGIIEDVTCATVRLTVRNQAGAEAEGIGCVLLSDLWAWPGGDHEAKDAAMREGARQYAETLAAEDRFRHPLELSAEAPLPGAMPPLAGAVCATAADSALHDAFGKVNGISAWDGLGPAHMAKDLSAYLGAQFRGRYPSDFLRAPVATVEVFHTVGAGDKLYRTELTASDPTDGLPACLEDWIQRDGIFGFKIKLVGDPHWDAERTAAIARLAGPTGALLADANEAMEGPETLVEYVRRLRETAPDAAARLLFIEQPFRRLSSQEADQSLSHYTIPDVGIPIFADESIVTVADVRRAFAQGYDGIVLKTCRRHSQVVLHLALAAAAGKGYMVQDLTHVGPSLLHSAALAARVGGLAGFEYNSRQYLPSHAPLPVSDGRVVTPDPRSPGLGA